MFQTSEFSTTANQTQDSGQAPRKTNGPREKTGCLGGNPTGTAGAAESCPPAISSTTVPLPLHVITCLIHHATSPAFCPAGASLRAAAISLQPLAQHQSWVGSAVVGHLTSNGILVCRPGAARRAWRLIASEHLTLQTCRGEEVNV